MPRSTMLMGAPGAGKSMMACLTVVNPPVHVIDVDRKMAASYWAEAALKSGALTYWELAEPLEEESIRSRVRQLATNEKMQRAPKGWVTFAEYYQRMPEQSEAKAAGTWVIDSGTQLGEHFKTHLMYLAGKNKLTFDQWMAYLTGWRDTLSFIRDVAIEHNKDLIFIVHERDKEVAGDRTTGVKYEFVGSGDNLSKQRVLQGTLDLAVLPSIDGSFSQQIAGYFNEVYWLYVEEDADKEKMPHWRCRVVPDGRRALRTSFKVTKPIHNPSFKEIWR